MKAIILAGGLGTRLRPLTETTPKPLLPIKDKPIIEHAVLNFKKHGITDIVLSIGYKADLIKEYFGDGSKWGVNIDYSIEDSPLGTGGAIKKAASGVEGTFLAINGDNLADFDWTEAIKSHKENNAKITLSLYPVEDVTQFGIAQLDNGRIVKFIEKPKVEEAPSNLNNAGGYVIEPESLNILPEGVSSIERDCFEKLAGQGVVFAHIHRGHWYPTDTLEKYKKADESLEI
jgi:mannose-1-phosphate guanylyltransferase